MTDANDPGAPPQRPDPDDSAVYRSVDGHDLPLHLFLPRGTRGPSPVVVLIHGGGWANGNPRQFFWLARQLADAGLVGCSISYRLSHQALYPAAVEDCGAAIEWLREHAHRLSIDPDRLGVIGSSAGGSLAAMLGVGGDEAPNVKAVVDLHGIHDMPPLDGCFAGQRCEQFLGASLADAPDLWRTASPVNHVTGRAAPMLLLHDPDDPVVPYSQSQRLFDALQAVGRPVQLIPTPGSGHGYIYDATRPWTRRVLPIMLHWLLQHL